MLADRLLTPVWRLRRLLTIALRPDRLLARLDASAAQQIAVLPGDISDWVEPVLLVETAAIQWGGRPPRKYRKSGLAILDGDWDICCRQPIDIYLRSDVFGRSIHELFVEGRPYTETMQYLQMVERLKQGDTPKNCASMADICAYFDRLCRIYRMIEAAGYRSQVELDTGLPRDEIMVYVDRNGELHKQQGSGHHRLAIARLLKVKHVPVCVLGVHKRWVVHCHRRFGGDVISALQRGMSEELSVTSLSTP